MTLRLLWRRSGLAVFGALAGVVAKIRCRLGAHVELYRVAGKMYDAIVAMRTVMVRRFIFVVAAVIWVAAPVLACVPNAAMTDAEMACCQKMGGECDMGVGNHACCKDSMRRAPVAAVAAVVQSLHVDVQSVAIAAVADVSGETFTEHDAGNFLVHVGLPGLPLELNSILRI